MKYLFFILIIAFLIVVLYYMSQNSIMGISNDICDYATFHELMERGVVESIVEKKKYLVVKLVFGETWNGNSAFLVKLTTSSLKDDAEIMKAIHRSQMLRNPIYVEFADFNKGSSKGGWFYFLIGILPILILVFVILFSLFSSGKKMGGFGFGMDNLLNEKETYIIKDVNTKMSDIAGSVNAKNEIDEIIYFLKNPNHAEKHGVIPTKGILLSGPPGTGKTLLARAIAGESGLPFLHANGTDFIKMIVGLGSYELRKFFAEAMQNSPCVMFVDEIDALGGNRDDIHQHSENKAVLNQLLALIDGFVQMKGVLIIGATNRPGALDKALTRSGRLEVNIEMQLPGIKDRQKLLEYFTIEKKLDEDVNILGVSKSTFNFSQSDIKNLVNTAAIYATRWNLELINMKCFIEALKRISLGISNDFVFSEKVLYRTAIHECSHLILAFGNSISVEYVTIIPSGKALGVVHHSLFEEEDEKDLTDDPIANFDLNRLISRISTSLASVWGEHINFGDFGLGVKSDTEGAYNLAREWVFSVGVDNYSSPEEVISTPFVLSQYGHVKNEISEIKKEELEGKISIIMKKAHEVAKKSVQENLSVIQALAKHLVKVEFMSKKDVIEWFRENSVSIVKSDGTVLKF